MNGFEDKRSLKALHVRLDRNSGLPTGPEAQGNGAFIVPVGVTPYQGAWESQVQEEGRQVLRRWSYVRPVTKTSRLDAQCVAQRRIRASCMVNQWQADGNGHHEKTL
jgi:hypothetical protein